MSALAHRLRRDERGITLVELMVAVLVSAIVLSAVGAFFVTGTKALTLGRSVDLSTRQAATAMQQLTRYLHVATPNPVSTSTTNPAFISATSTSIDFTAYVNLVDASTLPVEVNYALDATGQLVQTTTAATCDATTGYCTFPATNVKRRTVLTGPIASPTVNKQPLFSFVDASGNALTTLGIDPAAIAAVTVNLEVGSTKAGASGNATMTSTIALLNLVQGSAAGGNS